MTLHTAHVAATESRDLARAPRDLHGLGLTNRHTANTANKATILHQMLNEGSISELHLVGIHRAQGGKPPARSHGTDDVAPMLPVRINLAGRRRLYCDRGPHRH